MASVYTTKRGKTKKAKLGIRKDSNNNAANKLNCKISNPGKKPQAEAPTLFKSQQELLLKQRGEAIDPTLALTAKCSNTKCKPDKSATDIPKLSLCSACNSVSYCCRDCQIEHWSIHKVKCLQIRQSIENEAKKSLDLLSAQMELLKTQEENTLKPFDATTIVVGENPYAIKKSVKKEKINQNEKEDDNENEKHEQLEGESKVNWSLFSNEAEVEISSEDEESDE
ncbi:hypothetical protein RB653_006195 [Dictyostelium firmibasis]|uniref:MYND-type domain-containing protein n=1 Tax=Dictyostelium firmibasis TaxID=79012 RepID=A0AAN7U9C6_9MYCE